MRGQKTRGTRTPRTSPLNLISSALWPLSLIYIYAPSCWWLRLWDDPLILLFPTEQEERYSRVLFWWNCSQVWMSRNSFKVHRDDNYMQKFIWKLKHTGSDGIHSVLNAHSVLGVGQEVATLNLIGSTLVFWGSFNQWGRWDKKDRQRYKKNYRV